MKPSILIQVRLTAALLITGLLAGCETYNSTAKDYSVAWKGAQLQSSVDETSKQAAKATADKSAKDLVVWHLEQGTVLRTAALANLPVMPPAPPKGSVPPGAPVVTPQPVANDETRASWFKQSNDAFGEAFTQVTVFDEQAKTKLRAETKAVLTNLAQMPYRGTGYDNVMLHTYVAANYLALGDRDRVRVELNRLLQSQRDAVEAHAKQIAEAQDEAAKAKAGTLATDATAKPADATKPEPAKSDSPSLLGLFGGKSAPKTTTAAAEAKKPAADNSFDSDATLKDPKFAAVVGGLEKEINAKLCGYESYVNPFSVFLDGLYFATCGSDGADIERAHKSFERVAGMNPTNSYLKDDLAMAEDLANGKKAGGLTYVIFETGSAPHQEEWKIDIPLFAFSQKMPNVIIALPKLAFNDQFVPSLTVTAAGKSYPSALVCNMDGVVAQEFKNNWPAVLTKSLISAAIKASADAVTAKYNADHPSTTSFLVNMAVKISNVATTVADTRSWTSLPKQFHYARFATPENRSVSLNVGGVEQVVALAQGDINLVWVKSVQPGSPVYVAQTVLR